MAAAHPLTDHDEIRRWAEERKGRPACVRGTGRAKGDTGMIRIDFPGFSGARSLQQITWDEWFRQFDENQLALLVQDSTARGQKSNFNKLVSREAAEGRVHSRRRAREQRAPTRSAARKAKPTGGRKTARKSTRTTKKKSAAKGDAGRTRAKARSAKKTTRASKTRQGTTGRGASAKTRGAKAKSARRS